VIEYMRDHVGLFYNKNQLHIYQNRVFNRFINSNSNVTNAKISVSFFECVDF
jgi:hypothetical protein